jgi:hypothetical protein
MLGRLITMVIAILTGVAVAGLALLGPGPLAGVLPEPVVARLEQWVGPAGLLRPSAGSQGETPAEMLDDGPEGLVANGPIAASAGNTPVLITDVLNGRARAVDQAIPAEITTIRPILGCMLTPPQPGTVVGHVTAGISDLPMAMVSYGDTDLAAGLKDYVARYRKTGEAVAKAPASIAYQAFDVAVTETSGPVYLVLLNDPQAGVANRIWNIHLAEGVRIERVVLLGGRQAGVANLDPVIPVEVILDDGLADCGIKPAYALNAGNAVFRAAAEGRMTSYQANAEIAEVAAKAEAFDIWFRDRFGVLAGQARVGFDQGQVAVIGPVPVEPTARAVYAKLDGARLRTTQDSYFAIAGQVPDDQTFPARVSALALRFAFGDLAYLRQGVEF